MKRAEVRELLESLYERYNKPEFIVDDPVSVIHRFSDRKDAEIAGFLTATIAWGNRKSIIQSAEKMITIMGSSPMDFVIHAPDRSLNKLTGAIHRTFNATDFTFFIRALRRIYTQENGMEHAFTHAFQTHQNAGAAIHEVRGIFLQERHEHRSEKHFADPLAGSAAKRINMFLRWMVRNDGRGVDLGLWRGISPAWLSIPLDVHSGNVARDLKLLRRASNDAAAVQELDAALRKFDPADPVKYDYALFGVGVDKKSIWYDHGTNYE